MGWVRGGGGVTGEGVRGRRLVGRSCRQGLPAGLPPSWRLGGGGVSGLRRGNRWEGGGGGEGIGVGKGGRSLGVAVVACRPVSIPASWGEGLGNRGSLGIKK